MHLSSSQAPLVAGFLTHRGRSRHSYWLILSDLVCFKWITKSGAWQKAKCMVSLLSVTVSRDFLWSRPSHFSQSPKLFFADSVESTHSSLSWKHPFVNRTPIASLLRHLLHRCWWNAMLDERKLIENEINAGLLGFFPEKKCTWLKIRST